MIAVGEESGDITEMLQLVGDVYEDEVDTAVEQLTAVIEPIMIVVMGVMVGGMLVAMYLPMFKMASVMSGILGLGDGRPGAEAETDAEVKTRRLPRFPRPPRLVFVVWLGIYAVVGAQMGWILRPFIGTPDMPFTVFRDRESNFLLAVVEALRQLFQQ